MAENTIAATTKAEIKEDFRSKLTEHEIALIAELYEEGGAELVLARMRS